MTLRTSFSALAERKGRYMRPTGSDSLNHGGWEKKSRNGEGGLCTGSTQDQGKEGGKRRLQF